MLIQQNQMRAHRKGSRLTQPDIAFIMGLSNHCIVSKWEKMGRRAGNGIILVYHLLFDIPVDEDLGQQVQELARMVAERAALRARELRALPPDPRVTYRISFLESVASRLSAQKA
jgi:transcriptional regulator with XRE-family HTH domain